MEQSKTLENAAAKYREYALQMKELEALAKPLKDQIVAYAKKVNVKTLKVGDVVVERRETLKAELDSRKVTPDWLYRLQRDGFGDLVEFKVGRAAAEDAAAQPLMSEAGMTAEFAYSFAVKV
jgi:hypothetical protein